jgi:histidine ammonia-lyase
MGSSLYGLNYELFNNFGGGILTVVLDGKGLTIEKLVKVARNNEKIEVSPEGWERIKNCRKIVERLIERKEKLYGITTGIGELSEVFLTPEQVKEFQRYLVYSHAAGWGEPVAMDDARAAIVTRINTHAKGHSGLRPLVVETLVDVINKGVTPVMCQKGSVGASGDLSPMAQMALVPMGEGEAFYQGKRMSGKEAMSKAGIKTIKYEAKDGLATINGSNVICGMGALQLFDAERLIKISEIAAAMSIDALKCNMKAFDERIHKVRGYPGAIDCAENIRKITEGSEILAQKEKKVQDAYSLRSTPQVIGAAKDTMKFCRQMFEIEMNAGADNPLFFEDDGGICLTGANFQGTPLAFALEYLGISLTTNCVISERRFNRLTNSNLSAGLPPFLTKGAGMFSGMMLAQYTAASLVCENRVLSTPAATGSIPTAADQEDFVSMGMTTAIKTRQILENACAIIGIELMGAAQAFDFRKPLKPGKGCQAAYDLIRKHVDFLDEDRPLYGDITKMAELVKSNKILETVEKEVGKLK